MAKGHYEKLPLHAGDCVKCGHCESRCPRDKFTLASKLHNGFFNSLEDRGYDTDAILLKAAEQGMTPVIPPRKNRKHLREYDGYLYKLR